MSQGRSEKEEDREQKPEKHQRGNVPKTGRETIKHHNPHAARDSIVLKPHTDRFLSRRSCQAV